MGTQQKQTVLNLRPSIINHRRLFFLQVILKPSYGRKMTTSILILISILLILNFCSFDAAASSVSTSSSTTTGKPSETNNSNSVFNLSPCNEQIKSQQSIDKTQIQHDILFFKPHELYFSEHPMCIIQERRVRLYNIGNDSVRILSISTDSQDFQANIVSPESVSNQTLSSSSSSSSSSSTFLSTPSSKVTNEQTFLELLVSFLPRRVGTAQGRIVVQTELGPLVYHVKGRGKENRYEVKPILKHQLPLGVDYRRSILLHNPHSEPLKIHRFYSNDSLFALKSTDVYQVDPHQKRSIATLSVRPSRQDKYQGMIYIDTNFDNLAIQTEILVVKSGAHPTSDELDFGVLTAQDETRKREIELLNSGNTAVQILDIYLSNPSKDVSYSLISDSEHNSSNHVNVQANPPIVRSSGVETIAAVEFTASEDGLYEGTVVLRTNESSRLEIPYRSKVVKGSLEYSQEVSSFLIGHSKPRSFTLFNRFSQPVQFSFLSLLGEDASKFKVENFQPGTVIWPDAFNEDISVELAEDLPANQTNCDASILIKSNITDFYLPLKCFDGSLSVGVIEYKDNIIHIVDKLYSQMEFGFVLPGSHVQKQFWVENTNPLSLKIESWHSTVDAATLKIVGLVSSESNSIVPFSGDILELKPSQKAIFYVDIKTERGKDIEENGVIQFNTTFGTTITLPLHYISIEGSISLSVGTVNFGPSFPGKILSEPLIAINSFNRSVGIKKIRSLDPRFVPEYTASTIEAKSESHICTLHFDPSRFGGIQSFENISFGGPEFISADELEVWSAQRKLYSGLPKTIISDIVISTDFYSKLVLEVSGQLSKPSILSSSELVYERTHVGNSIQKYIRVMNPSNRSVQAQLLSISDLTAAVRDPVLSSLSLSSSSLNQNNIIFNSPRPFSWKRGFESDRDPFLVSQDQHISIIEPYSQALLGPVIFTPSTTQKKESIILVKNNLTGLEPVHAKGEGGYGRLEFYTSVDSRSPLNKLNFETSSEEYPAHERSVGIDEEMVFVRNFTVWNTGNVDVRVEKGAIGGIGCSAFGVTLRQCGSMTIKANSFVQITLEFRPDFSTTHMQLQLKFYSNIGKVSIPLSITMPPHFLHHYYGRDTHFTSNTSLRYLLLVIILLGLLYLTYIIWNDVRLGVCVVIGRNPYRTKRKFDSEAPSDEEWSPEVNSNEMISNQDQYEPQDESLVNNINNTMKTPNHKLSVYSQDDFIRDDTPTKKEDVDSSHSSTNTEKTPETGTDLKPANNVKNETTQPNRSSHPSSTKSKKETSSTEVKSQLEKNVPKPKSSKHVQHPSSPQKQTRYGSKPKRKKNSENIMYVKTSSSSQGTAKSKEANKQHSKLSSTRSSIKKTQQQSNKSKSKSNDANSNVNNNKNSNISQSKTQHGSSFKKHKNRVSSIPITESKMKTTKTSSSSSSVPKQHNDSSVQSKDLSYSKSDVRNHSFKQFRRRRSISDSHPPSFNSTPSSGSYPSDQQDDSCDPEHVVASSTSSGYESQESEQSSPSRFPQKQKSAPPSPHRHNSPAIQSSPNGSISSNKTNSEERNRATSDPVSYVDDHWEHQAQQEIFKILNENRSATAPSPEIFASHSPSTETQGYWQNFPVSSSSSLISSSPSSSSTPRQRDGNTPAYNFEDIYSRLSDALHPTYHHPMSSSGSSYHSNANIQEHHTALPQQRSPHKKNKRKHFKNNKKSQKDGRQNSRRNKKQEDQKSQTDSQSQVQQNNQQQQQQQQQQFSMFNNQIDSHQNHSYSLFSNSHPYGSATSLFGGFTGVPQPSTSMTPGHISPSDYHHHYYQQQSHQQHHYPYHHHQQQHQQQFQYQYQHPQHHYYHHQSHSHHHHQQQQQHQQHFPTSFRSNPPFVPLRMHPPQEEDSFFSQSPTSFTLNARRHHYDQSGFHHPDPIPFNLHQSTTSLFPGSPSSEDATVSSGFDDNTTSNHWDMNSNDQVSNDVDYGYNHDQLSEQNNQENNLYHSKSTSNPSLE